MNRGPRFLVRADASALIGSGHLMRCLTLAEALAAGGAEVAFVCRQLPGNMIAQVQQRGFQVLPLPWREGMRVEPWVAHAGWLGEHWKVDADQTAAAARSLGSIDWLLVDHYALDARWEASMRALVGRIMVIDDLSDRKHDCDVLLNQNPAPGSADGYAGLVPEAARLLLGPRFALLRRGFSCLRGSVSTRRHVRKVLVFFGASDPADVTSQAIEALSKPDLLHLDVTVVVGASNPRANQVRELCARRPQTRFMQQIDDIERVMAESDLAIGAAGATTWERCALGLPSVVVSIADNQEPIARAARDAGACSYLGRQDQVGADAIAAAVRQLAGDPQALARMSTAAAGLADGKGVRRVLLALLRRPLTITVLSDADSWIVPHARRLVDAWQAEGHDAILVHKADELRTGDCAFLLGCTTVVSGELLGRNTNNLVVHESALPAGRGWSPLTWQVLEGRNEIPISLLEAVDQVDSGDVYLQDVMKFEGGELCAELRAVQGAKTVDLCMRFVDDYPWVLCRGRAQTGVPTFYPRRRPEDSRLDPDKSIRQQFHLLRVVDNDRYPAYFEIDGRRYVLRVEHARDASTNGDPT